MTSTDFPCQVLSDDIKEKQVVAEKTEKDIDEARRETKMGVECCYVA